MENAQSVEGERKRDRETKGGLWAFLEYLIGTLDQSWKELIVIIFVSVDPTFGGLAY